MIASKFLDNNNSLELEPLKSVSETCIMDMPQELNETRDISRGYDPEEALEMMMCLGIVGDFNINTVIQQSMFEDSKSLFLSLWQESAVQDEYFLIVCPPYTILCICAGDKIIMVDTHPVPATMGGTQNGLVLFARNHTDGCKDIFKWLTHRFGVERKDNLVEVCQIKKSNPYNQESSLESDEIDELDIQTSRSMLEISNWDLCVEESDIPYDVNGFRKFKLACTKKNMMSCSKDGRPWATWCSSSRQGFSGIRRLAKCRGSPQCTKIGCEISGKPNRGQFTKKGAVTICKLCDEEAEAIECPGRKIWEFRDGQVMVMYRGQHTCHPKKPEISSKQLKKELASSPNIPASRFVTNKLTTLMSSSEIDWKAVGTVAEEFVNIKRIENAKAVTSDVHGNSFDALCVFKRQTDKEDKYWIYRLNNNQLNNGMPSFAFKSSLDMAQLCLDMDRNGKTHLGKSYAYFDAKHDRTLDMKTLTLWTYHPVFQRILCLAVMDVDRENTECIVLFWKYLNEMLQEVSGDNKYLFNPSGWIVD